MTRLVGVRAVCDGCSAAAAVLFCVSHRNVLCRACDAARHSTPSTASHQRVDLASAVTALPFCEYCDDAPATTYCESEGSTLCDKCDAVVHQSVPVPHSHTPIERTLRSRAVEFRSSARPRLTGRPRTAAADPDKPKPNSRSPDDAPVVESATPSAEESRKTAEDRQNGPAKVNDWDSVSPPLPAPRQWYTPHPQPPPRPPIPKPTRPSSARQPRPIQPHPTQIRPDQQQHPPLRTEQSRSQPMSQTQSLPSQLSSRPISQQPPHSSRRRARPLSKRKREAPHRTSQPIVTFPAQSSFPRTEGLSPDGYFVYPHDARTSTHSYLPLTSDVPTGPPLQESVLMDTDARYPLDFNMMPYDSLDLSGEATAIEGINGSGKSASASGSAAGSGVSSRRKTPEFDSLPIEPRAPRSAPAQSSLTVAAMAAMAAGELYLLNSVSSGSGSSRERMTPPGDISRAPDPAGVAAAATRAAESVGEGVGARAHVSQGAARLVSESGMPTTHGIASVAAAQQALCDEAKRTLELESRRAKNEESMRAEGGVVDRDRGEGNAEQQQLVAQMSDGDEVLRRGEVMGDLEMPREDFGVVFDPIDLSSFEQNGSGGLGFTTGEFHASLDSDEG